MLLRHVAPSPLLPIKALALLVAGVVVVGYGGERTEEAPGGGSMDPGSKGRGGCLRVKRGPPAGTARIQAGEWQGWVWRQRNSPFRLEHRVRVSILRGGKGPAL